MKHYPFQEQRAQPSYAVAYTSVNTIEDQLQRGKSWPALQLIPNFFLKSTNFGTSIKYPKPRSKRIEVVWEREPWRDWRRRTRVSWCWRLGFGSSCGNLRPGSWRSLRPWFLPFSSTELNPNPNPSFLFFFSVFEICTEGREREKGRPEFDNWHAKRDA